MNGKNKRPSRTSIFNEQNSPESMINLVLCYLESSIARNESSDCAIFEIKEQARHSFMPFARNNCFLSCISET